MQCYVYCVAAVLRSIGTGQLSTHSSLSLIGSPPSSYGGGASGAPLLERTSMNFADLMARIALREPNPPFYDAIAVLCCVLLATRTFSFLVLVKVCTLMLHSYRVLVVSLLICIQSSCTRRYYGEKLPVFRADRVESTCACAESNASDLILILYCNCKRIQTCVQQIIMPPLVSHTQEKSEHGAGSASALPVEAVGSKLICHLTLRIACTTPDAFLPPHAPLALSSRLRPAAPATDAELAADDGALLWLPSWNITDRGTNILRDSSLVHLLNAELISIQPGRVLYTSVLVLYTSLQLLLHSGINLHIRVVCTRIHFRGCPPRPHPYIPVQYYYACNNLLYTVRVYPMHCAIR